jgi:peptide/nickel transport system permease protein
MARFALRRLLHVVPVLWGLSTVVFLMLRLLPGNVAVTLLSFRYTAKAAALLTHQLGLDKPLLVQYLHYWENLFQGNFGRSAVTSIPVLKTLGTQFPPTLALALSAMGVAIVIGIPAGAFAAVRFRSVIDSLTVVVATLGLSIPPYFLGIVLILIFSVALRLVPVVGGSGFAGLILPALAVGLPVAGYVARVVRASMLEVLGAEYITTARSKGLPDRVVVVRHALRNALVPIVTVLGLQFGQMLGGVVIVENVFARPGIGQTVVTAIEQRDIPLVQGCVLLLGVIYVVVNLLTDILYAAINPQIRMSGAAR